MFGKKDSAQVTAEDRNEATKLIRQFGGLLKMAEAIEKLGNVQSSVAESQSALVGLQKDKETSKTSLASVNAKVKVAQKTLQDTNYEVDFASSKVTKLNNTITKMETDQVKQRSVHESLMNTLDVDANRARERITSSQEEAKVIIGRAELVKTEAAAQKLDASKIYKKVEAKRLELEDVEQSIANAKAEAKNQLERITSKL